MFDGIKDPEGIAFLNAYGRRLDPKYVAQRLKALCRKAGSPRFRLTSSATPLRIWPWPKRGTSTRWER